MSTGPLLDIPLDRSRPLGRQLEARLRETVRAGGLPAGSRLPSTRALAADLGLSRGVVVSAYEQLASEGYIVLRRGAAPQVAHLPQLESRSVEPDVPLAGVAYTLRPDLPDLALFPRAEWTRATRAVLARVADTDL